MAKPGKATTQQDYQTKKIIVVESSNHNTIDPKPVKNNSSTENENSSHFSSAESTKSISVPEWQIFNRVPHAQAIADGLKDIPEDWSLTPIQDKAPKRDGWEHEPFILHSTIADLIFKGERKTSKKSGKQYTAFYSGFGLRTGEQSGGKVAIDIDGPSAEPILQRMSGGILPQTPGWTSGKPGRRQIVFQVPDHIRPLLTGFNRAVVTESGDLKTVAGEQLEFRYNNHQSCLPPSRHPQTGAYTWIDSPVDTPVAIAPQWLCDKLVELANQERQDSERQQQQAEEYQRQAEERRHHRQLNIIGATSLEDVLEESQKRLRAEDIYNWSGHNWHYQGNELLGCCPRHQSSSGKSFHVDTKTLKWYCFNCRVGGGPTQYRHFAQGGNGTPKKKDFVEVLRGLASDAGVQMPELPKPSRDRGIITAKTRKKAERETREQYWQNPPQEDSPHPGAFVRGQSHAEAPSAQALWDLRYEPDLVVNQRYLDIAGIEADFLCIVSAMNTGKTHALSELLAKPTTSVLAVVNTVALAEALAVRYGLSCYNEKDLDINACTRLVITVDSFHKLKTLDKRFDVVLLDEADQVTKHMLTSTTCKKTRSHLLRKFEYFTATASKLILADADLSGTTIDWHVSQRKKKPFILHNLYKPAEGRKIYRMQSEEAVLAVGFQALEDNQRVAFCVDSKKAAKSIGSLLGGTKHIEGFENLAALELQAELQAKYPEKKGIVIHGDNSGTPQIRQIIQHINRYLEIEPLDYLIFNSSMQSGISIDVEAFDQIVGIGYGYSLTHTEFAQLLHRYRPSVPITLYLNPDGYRRLETNCYKIRDNYLQNNYQSGIGIKIDPTTGIVGAEEPEFLAAVASLEARRNWSLLNFAEATVAHLEGMGYEVVPHPDEALYTDLDAIKQEFREHKKIATEAEIATICVAGLIGPEEAETLGKQPSLTFGERCTLEHFHLHEYYGMKPTPELIRLDNGGEKRRALTQLELLLNPESFARRLDLSDRRKHPVISDLKHHSLKLNLLRDLGLDEFLSPFTEYGGNSLVALGERARARAIDIKRILGFTISLPPRYLRIARSQAHRAVGALFHPTSDLGAKLLLAELSKGEAPKNPKKTFASEDEANIHCRQLSPVNQILCEVISIEKRCQALTMSDSQIHAVMCGVVGLNREQTRRTREGKGFYKITQESWDFALEVFLHHEQQREGRRQQKEQELREAAQRFQNTSAERMQSQIEADIAEAKSALVEPPVLAFVPDPEPEPDISTLAPKMAAPTWCYLPRSGLRLMTSFKPM